ncbi:hypothetical protein J2S53_001867 [Actinopolyspora lacussalsi]|uniref:Uncharacterized protein n=2 Tax=Actinopolyspora alba group TaxID=2893675 RepID=A0A1I1XI34_9ACTN|nr:hypothetical protein [Actinopolyspora lacussalsi]SFE05403.1 hypothetical protein SAMN04487819_10777 [Actinopolyspora alba]SFT79000.1 hypothetical protein SAMN04487904_108144 [Actinopolyspora righensis]
MSQAELTGLSSAWGQAALAAMLLIIVILLLRRLWNQRGR